MSNAKTHIDVQVVFKDHIAGIKSQKDKVLTPQQVIEELEKFAQTIRETIKYEHVND